MINLSAKFLLTKLISEGIISDAEKAHMRFRLGYPMWLILEEELGSGRAVAVLSEASGLPELGSALEPELLDTEAARTHDPTILRARRWAPLVDGRVAVADNFGPLPDGDLANRKLCLASAREIDGALGTAFPDDTTEADDKPEVTKLRRLGRLLLDEGAISEQDLALGPRRAGA